MAIVKHVVAYKQYCGMHWYDHDAKMLSIRDDKSMILAFMVKGYCFRSYDESVTDTALVVVVLEVVTVNV